MKRIWIFIISVIAVLGLTSCGESDIPNGMQLCSGSEEKGYFFYVPEGWAVFENGGVSTAYVSTANTTTVNFTEITSSKIKKTDGYVCGEEGCKGASLAPSEHYFLYHYFDETEFPSSMKLIGEGDVLFGKDGESADRCRYFEFSYVHRDVKYTEDGSGTLTNDITRGFKQYYIVKGESFYLMTYSAVLDVPEFLNSSYYEQYTDEMATIVENFRFVTKKAGAGASQQTPSEDFRLVTDKRLTGFDFYAAKDFTVDFSSGIISVSTNDGANVNMTKVTAVGTYSTVYFERRLQELREMGASEVTIISRNNSKGEATTEPLPSKLGELPIDGVNTQFNYAFDLEYTYVFDGVKYHVYQVMGVKSFFLSADGYVFTYTATEDSYAKHLDTVKAMRDKVSFE